MLPKWSPKKIRGLRAEYGEDRRTFGRRMGVSEFTIRCWELGSGVPIGPARLLMSRLEEDLQQGKKRELQPV